MSSSSVSRRISDVISHNFNRRITTIVENMVATKRQKNSIRIKLEALVITYDKVRGFGTG